MVGQDFGRIFGWGMWVKGVPYGRRGRRRACDRWSIHVGEAEEKHVGYAENTNRGTCECDCARISRRLMVLIGEEMGI